MTKQRVLAAFVAVTSITAGQRVATVLGSEPGSNLQVPSWSADDMSFFLHGSMSSEIVPENVLRAFIRTYPDAFTEQNLTNFGLTADKQFGWPVGFSRARPVQLAGLPSVGLNCASCHVAEVTPPSGGERVRVLGVTSHFDAEAFFGSVIGATFRTAKPENMGTFLARYLEVCEPLQDEVKTIQRQVRLTKAWKAQREKVEAAMAADPAGAKEAGANGFNELKTADLELSEKNLDTVDFAKLSVSMLKLFHNMRLSLHLPDQPPEKLPPAAGPGRNDAFGLLSVELFQSPQPYAPVKFGVVWNLEHRRWVHWDGNTQSPLGRNILASIGLGSPLVQKKGWLDFNLVKRQTDLSEKIAPPKYPWEIDNVAAERGAALYRENCARCHDGEEGDSRLHALDEIGTDPTRARAFDQKAADNFNKFLSEFETKGFTPPKEPQLRSTQKYWAASLPGVWARSPYLHNGSVRTMQQLLTPPAEREKTFHRGARRYDSASMGYADEGSYTFDTAGPGNANTGHDYGTQLKPEQKRDLIEYLKTL